MKPGRCLLLLLLIPALARGGSATWQENPVTNDWNTAANWTPMTVPKSPADTATFGLSNTTEIELSETIEIDGLHFVSGASAYTITCPTGANLRCSGAGITNDSGVTQHFVVAENTSGGPQTDIKFGDHATAGSATDFLVNDLLLFINSASAGRATFLCNDEMRFMNTTSAGNGTFVISGVSFFNASIIFYDSATAAQGTFTVKGGPVVGDLTDAFLSFAKNSSAGNALIVAEGFGVSGAPGGNIWFSDSATAGNATLMALGGSNGGGGGIIKFFGRASGGTAQFQLFGNGALDLSFHDGAGVTIGSLEGDGMAFLGGVDLAIGSNGESTMFSGTARDGGVVGGHGGSLTKIGAGILTLSGPNTYTGGTSIEGGTLSVDGATGPGPVEVNAGTLGGRGTIAGSVTIASGALLAAATDNSPLARLTILSALTFQAGSACSIRLDSRRGRSDRVVANGITIENVAQLDFRVIGHGRLRVGQVATLLSNTAASPIAGTFANLPDNSIITGGRNSFKVSYEGGDGNDLTLTVVNL